MNLITLYTCKIGSHAYGLTTPDSDLDLRGVVVPDDLAYYFGTKTFEQQVYSEEEDHVAWHLRKFCHLASKGNTQMLEMLFSPQDCWVSLNPLFHMNILDNRDKFITNEIFNAIHGYAYSEHRKALGESSRDLGERRKQDVASYGYSGRNASHCIRLLYAGAQALTMGVFPVRLESPERDTCMALKLGQMKLEEYERTYATYLDALESACVDSKLPARFDDDWLNTTLVKMHLELMHNNKLL
jgi:predicted nucleotidyltransferase